MNKRLSVEYLKAILIGMMALTHSFSFVGVLIAGDISSQFCYLFSMVGKLIEFSGFVFCYGYASYYAYLSKPYEKVRPNLTKTAQNQLAGYFLSALLATLLLPIPGHPTGEVGLGDVWNVLTLQYIGPYSEFMLTYLLLTVSTLLFFRPLSRMAQSHRAMLMVGAVSLVATALIPYELFIDNPLGLLIGSRNYAAFPLVQYLIFYVAGIYFARFNVIWRWPVALVAAVGTLAFAGFYSYTGEFPVRFPPSLFWICGSWGLLYALYLLMNWLVDRGFRSSVLSVMGSNTLLFLLLSNMILFPLSSRFKTTPVGSLLIGVVVIAACWYIVRITRKPAPQAPVEPQTITQHNTQTVSERG